MSASVPPRKRTKTFTGCWTCRARKIKCDEVKPECRQCSDKGFHCEGYSARLQWLTPGTHQRGLDIEEPPRTSMKQSLRRLLPTEPPTTTLKWAQIDNILGYLDSLELVVNNSSEDISANINNFGVFSLAKKSSATQVDDPSITSSAPHGSNTSRRQLENRPSIDPCSIDPCSELTAASNLPNESSEVESSWALCNLYESELAADFPDEQTSITANTVVYVPPAVAPSLQFTRGNSNLPESSNPAKSVISDEDNSTPASHADPDFPSPRYPLDNLLISPQERYLMGHYRNRVVNLFCVIDNAKSPWKTIHLPRVLQCAGELSFGGTTTRIRDALKKSLLSISAFYLSNDHRANHRTLDAENWGTIASRYRCDAIGLLKHAVETDLYADNPFKYKEFLATMLSMVTINVMSGDTSTCSVHLDGVEKMISYVSSRKSTFSRKARSLHRIYLYLRVIYETTAVNTSQSRSSRFSPTLDCCKTFGTEPISPNHTLFEDTPSSTLPLVEGLRAGESPLPELTSYECIYGIPLSLLLLLKETIEAIDKVQRHQTDTDTLSPPESLSQACDGIEQKIMDWPLEERLETRKALKNATSETIIFHQTQAFLNALIILFSQGVRSMGHRYLRQYVHKILDSIEAIEQLKAETKVLAAPLFWPAFMGATEAFEPVLQERFRRWYSRVEIYGIEAARTGIKVLHEVWRRGPTNYRDKNSGWRAVVKESNECLMLT